MYDLVVLGGGPAGVTAALRAKELGAHVALVERGRLGGTCTNDGCVPTRVLAKAARLMRDAEQLSDYGLYLDAPPTVNFNALLQRTRQVIEVIHEKKQLIDHLQDVGVAMFTEAGDSRFVDSHTIEMADGTTLQGRRFVLCVGGSSRQLPLPGIEHTITASDVWELESQPQSLVIVGGGATGCQLASVMDTFGTQVTLLDIAPRILAGEDRDVSEAVTRAFQAHGIHVQTGIDGIDAIEKQGTHLRLRYRMNGDEQIIDAEAVLMAVGWPGNVDGLGLDAAGVETERSYIKTDDYMRTTAEHIYAAGDITGRMMLVQSAGYQARVAVENALLGEKNAAQHRLVPHGGFTDPEYGSVGPTEEEAAQNHDIVVAMVPYRDMDRAIIDGRTTGFCKLIVDRDTHLILGAHVVGEQAVEIVSLVSAGMAGDATVEEISELELAYPTFAAVVGLAAREITRELGSMVVAPVWRALQGARAAEWERVREEDRR